MDTFSAPRRFAAALVLTAFAAFSCAAMAEDYIPGVPNSGTVDPWEVAADPDAARVRYHEYATEVRETTRLLDQSENVGAGISTTNYAPDYSESVARVYPYTRPVTQPRPVTIVVIPTRDAGSAVPVNVGQVSSPTPSSSSVIPSANYDANYGANIVDANVDSAYSSYADPNSSKTSSSTNSTNYSATASTSNTNSGAIVRGNVDSAYSTYADPGKSSVSSTIPSGTDSFAKLDETPSEPSRYTSDVAKYYPWVNGESRNASVQPTKSSTSNSAMTSTSAATTEKKPFLGEKVGEMARIEANAQMERDRYDAIKSRLENELNASGSSSYSNISEVRGELRDLENKYSSEMRDFEKQKQAINANFAY